MVFLTKIDIYCKFCYTNYVFREFLKASHKCKYLWGGNFIMKRTMSFILAILLCMTLYVPAFAEDVSILKNLNVSFLEKYSVKVTPAKGTNLKFVGNARDNIVTLKVYKNGGWWASTTITLPEDGAAKTYDLITNCNGEEYELVFSTGGIGTVIGYICQTEVI